MGSGTRCSRWSKHTLKRHKRVNSFISKLSFSPRAFRLIHLLVFIVSQNPNLPACATAIHSLCVRAPTFICCKTRLEIVCWGGGDFACRKS